MSFNMLVALPGSVPPHLIVPLACRIEETWRLWCKFLDDYSRFDDWLKTAERTAASPKSSGVLYTVAKEELKKFEVRFGKSRSV